jgi:hypothetical protein
MQKSISLFTFIVFFSLFANAQKGWRLGVAVQAGLANNSKYGLVIGADARIQTNISGKDFFILTSGITHFFDTPKTLNGFTYVPVKVGVKSYLAKHFYVSGEAGIGCSLQKEINNSFVWSPAMGISTKTMDVSIRYENYDAYQNFQHLALRLAYGFKL